MSKVVKSVGRAIGKVVKGVVKGVKKFAKSKIGKILLAAATIYFGGAAIMGAVGGASAGTGVLGTISGAVQGAGAGIANAWSGLTGAAGALTSGQGLGAAGSSLSSGFTGAYTAGNSAVTAGQLAASSGALPATPGAYGSAGTAGQTATTASTTGGITKTGAELAVDAAGREAASQAPGLVGRAWNGLGDYGKFAAVSGGMNIAGGAIQGYGQQKAIEEQRDYEQRLINQNVGAPIFVVDRFNAGRAKANNGLINSYVPASSYQTA